MTTLNTIIEEEKKEFEKVVKELGLREETIAGADEQETVWNLLTSAMQRAYEARVGHWESMQTAPKDGTHILVTNGIDCTVAHYFEGDTGGGWYLSWNRQEEDCSYNMKSITHWKPTNLDQLRKEIKG